jgi:hypothetical protein
MADGYERAYATVTTGDQSSAKESYASSEIPPLLAFEEAAGLSQP